VGLYLLPGTYYFDNDEYPGKSWEKTIEGTAGERVYVENISPPNYIKTGYGFDMRARDFQEKYISTKTGCLVGPSKLTINGYSLGDYPTK
jgi:hypothetical protein